MPVTITVSEVRDALYLAEGTGSGEGAPSTSVLGQWFHEGLGLLIQDGSSSGILAALAEVATDLDLWKQTLVDQVYARFVGPQLTRQQAALTDTTSQVLSFWDAMQAACHWVAELTWSLKRSRTSRRTAPISPWQTLAGWFSTEESLTCLLQEPGWSDSVLLVGVADAVVRLADTGKWCALEFKLGRTTPAVDLAQACLYHLMLTAAEQGRQSKGSPPQQPNDLGSLALISFHPSRHEQLFSASQLAAARQRLISVIGALAKVATSSPIQPSASRTSARPTSPHEPPARREKTQPTDLHRQLGNSIVKTLSEYGVDVTLSDQIDVGPTFLRFGILLGRGTKVSSVKKHAPEIQIKLHLKAVPFISSDDGRLVIDVQRPDRQMVNFDEIRSQIGESDSARSGSRVPIGIDLSGQLVCADLSKPDHSHILVAGTTGSGKSEWLRLAIAGLIETNTPETLRLLIIDPKRNAFHALRESPYLWRPIVFPDELPAVEVLEQLAEEMDRRYRVFDGADSFAKMVAKSEAPLPRIVCVCDEYRDLISRDRKERKLIEQQICRLGAKARAAGIHLILATQEPSRETIKGPLDSNMPARVGLKMGKNLESKMLLGEFGAENLLGNGDLLFKDIGPPRRLQAPLMSEANQLEIFGRGIPR